MPQIIPDMAIEMGYTEAVRLWIPTFWGLQTLDSSPLQPDGDGFDAEETDCTAAGGDLLPILCEHRRSVDPRPASGAGGADPGFRGNQHCCRAGRTCRASHYAGQPDRHVRGDAAGCDAADLALRLGKDTLR